MSTPVHAWHREIACAARLSLHNARLRNFVRTHARTIAKTMLVLTFALLTSHFAAMAQNLGTAPAFGQAVQGQQATTPEGTILNIVNWLCNVIAPIVGVGFLGTAAYHFKAGRGYGGWLASGIGMMMVSGFGRIAEGFITQAGAVR